MFTATALDALRADGGGWNFVVTLAPGADREAAIRAQRKAAVLGGPDPAHAARGDRPRRSDPRVAGRRWPSFVAVVALVAVGLALVSSLRRRRRELAVLKTLGFSRRQVRATVAWQASTVAAVGLVVGIPLGLLVGAYVWHQVADELGVSTDRTWPVLAIALLAVGAFLAVNLIAAVPGSPRCPYPSCRRPTIGVTVATRLDDIQPLDLASIRDDAPERPPWTSRATGSIALAVVAVVVVVVAALVGDRVPLGPGRALAIVLVAAWALAAVFVAVHRPSEPLAAIMALAAFVGAPRCSAPRSPDATSPPRPCATSAPACAARRSRCSPRSRCIWCSACPTVIARHARPSALGRSPATWRARCSRSCSWATGPTSPSRRSW